MFRRICGSNKMNRNTFRGRLDLRSSNINRDRLSMEHMEWVKLSQCSNGEHRDPLDLQDRRNEMAMICNL